MHASAEQRRRSDPDFLWLRLQAFYDISAIAPLVAILGGVLVASLFWSPATANTLAWWLAGLASTVLLRLLSILAYRRRRPTGWRAAAWVRVTLCCALLSGVAWGAAGWWLIGIGQDYQILVFACVVVGITMGTLAQAAYWPAHLCFHLPIFAGCALGFLRADSPASGYMVLACPLLALLVAMQGRAIGRQLVHTLQLAHENQALALQLAARSQALEQINRELATLSSTDALTGLPNRRALLAMLDAQWQQAAGHACALALLMVDVDHFKQYNDSFGHPAGDRCLALIGATLSAHIRKDRDMAARYGGEEFSVLLPEVDADRAQETAERLRRAIESLDQSHPGVLARPVTASIGMAIALPARHGGATDGPAALLEAADGALYEAKRRGRNRVVQGPVGDTPSRPPAPAVLTGPA